MENENIPGREKLDLTYAITILSKGTHVKNIGHIHSGPDLKNKATLGMLVAVSAIKDGHDVSLFLAADGVHLLNCSETGKVVGEGTGDLKEHLDFLQSANTTLWVSGMSAKARGYDENLLEGFNAQFAMPNRLVEASLEADTVLCY